MARDTIATGWFPSNTSIVLHFACQKDPYGLSPTKSSFEGGISVHFPRIIHYSNMHALLHRADVFASLYFVYDMCIPTRFQCPLLILLELTEVHTLHHQFADPAHNFIHNAHLQLQ